MDKTSGGILTRLKDDMPIKYNVNDGSYVHDILAPVAIEIEGIYSLIDLNFRKILVDTANGSDLDSALGQFGFERKNATYANGYVTVRGTENAVIHEGDLVAKGKSVYVVQHTEVLTNGAAVVEIVAQNPGSDGNALAGEVDYFPVILDGITSVTNEEEITGGTDAETDEEYRERYYYFLDNPVTTGNKYEYEQWAREVDGVGIAKCYPLWNGAGTVKIVITTADMLPAPNELVENVAAVIESKRPIGAQVTVESAKTISVYVSAKVVCDIAYSKENIGKRYGENLTEYFKTVGFAGGLIPYTKIGSLLQETEGVEYYSDLKINGSMDNISVNDGYLAVLGGVNLE